MVQENVIQEIREFLDKTPNVLFAHLFGSAAAGRQQKDSNLDIGIFFKRPPRGLALLKLISSLSEIAGADVDVVVLNKASAFLRHQVMKQRVEVTVKDRAAYIKFREKTISDYDAYKYISGMNVYD
jgi:predicted nucleotidyltransferase